MIDRRLSIAPMMDWTDRHDRYFLRLISKNTLLYTEMVTSGAVIHGDREHLIGYHASEHPIAIQLGGSEPAALAKSAQIAESFGYDEVNLNVGCPSDRVQNGNFGACLMKEPKLVAQCLDAMAQKVSIPVTIKHRTGVDDQDSYQELVDFVGTVKEVGCQTFIVHARKAWLEGLSPKQNREIPPLHYDRVYQLKKDFPELEIIINGGVLDLVESESHLQHVDGVMIGRAAYHNPYILAEADQSIFGKLHPTLSRQQIIEDLLPYVQQHLQAGGRLQAITRHILGLYHGQPRGRLWRRHLSENAHKKGADESVILEALKLVESDTL